MHWRSALLRAVGHRTGRVHEGLRRMSLLQEKLDVGAQTSCSIWSARTKGSSRLQRVLEAVVS